MRPITPEDQKRAFPYVLGKWYLLPKGDFGCLTFADATTLVFVIGNHANLPFALVGRAGAPLMVEFERWGVIERVQGQGSSRRAEERVEMAERKQLWIPDA